MVPPLGTERLNKDEGKLECRVNHREITVSPLSCITFFGSLRLSRLARTLDPKASHDPYASEGSRCAGVCHSQCPHRLKTDTQIYICR